MRALVAVPILFVAALATTAQGETKSFTVNGRVDELVLSRDGRWLAAAPRGAAPVLFFIGEVAEPEEGVAPPPAPPEQRELACPPTGVRSFAFTPDSKFLVVEPRQESEEQKIFVFSTETAEPVFEVDCAWKPVEGERNPASVYRVQPGVSGAEFHLLRDDGLEVWDCEERKRASKDEDFDPFYFLVARSAPLGICRDSCPTVVDPVTHAKLSEFPQEASKGQLKEPKRQKELNFRPSFDPCGISDDGKIVVLACDQERVLDQKKLADTSADPEDRLKAIKKYFWLEAFDTETGKSLWDTKISDEFSAFDTRYGGDRVGILRDGKFKTFDLRTGKSKASISSSKPLTAVASLDGETWWCGTESGAIFAKK